MPAAPLETEPPNTDDQKARRDAFQLILQGVHTATQTLSENYQQACVEVQGIIRRSLRKSTAINRTFVHGATDAIHRWVQAIHPVMDCMGESVEEQTHLLQEAQKARKQITAEVLALLPEGNTPNLPPVVLEINLLTPALTATRTHMDSAIETVSEQLLDLIHHHVPLGQAGVFLASLLQMICSYQQEMDSMLTNQVILPGQIIPDLWGVSRGSDGGSLPARSPNLPSQLAGFSSRVDHHGTHQEGGTYCSYHSGKA